MGKFWPRPVTRSSSAYRIHTRLGSWVAGSTRPSCLEPLTNGELSRGLYTKSWGCLFFWKSHPPSFQNSIRVLHAGHVAQVAHLQLIFLQKVEVEMMALHLIQVLSKPISGSHGGKVDRTAILSGGTHFSEVSWDSGRKKTGTFQIILLQHHNCCSITSCIAGVKSSFHRIILVAGSLLGIMALLGPTL